MGKAVMPAAIIDAQPVQDVIEVGRDREERAGEQHFSGSRFGRRAQSRHYARAQQTMCYRKGHRLSLPLRMRRAEVVEHHRSRRD